MNICPNCTSFDVVPVYKRTNVPTYQNVLLCSQKEALNVPRGILDLKFCNDCTFLFNAAFDDSLVGYGDSYENDQTHSAFFSKHIETVANKILIDNDINNHKILEIGCGNGYFLKKLILESNANVGFGYDQSLESNFQTDRISLYKKYYDKSDIENFDVVVSRHVVEHILDNNDVLSVLLKNNPNARFFIETPSLEWILKNNTFFDIFYEHCSYFSKHSLSKHFEKNGLSVRRSETVFDGQYLWIEGVMKQGGTNGDSTPIKLDMIKSFFDKLENMVIYYKKIITLAADKRKIAIWGAGAKGVTFANLIDPNNQLINCLIDINPKKCGKYLPGTGHKIVSPQEIQDNHWNVVIMNPNYQNEIYATLSGRNIEYTLLEEDSW